MTQTSSQETLGRINDALKAAVKAISPFIPGAVESEQKSGGRGPITEADRVSNRALYEALVRPGEGWLSEETVDDLARLDQSRVWVVDPVDGTSEFIAGIPEWCISIAMVENGQPVAGGICNPVTGETFLGAPGAGLIYNGQPAAATTKSGLAGTVVLASRSELKHGEWERFQNDHFEIRAMGSVAYKLALVAAGRADATWTLTPKNEWDVAAGAALLGAGGGVVRTPENLPLKFNQRSPALPGLFACGRNLVPAIAAILHRHP